MKSVVVLGCVIVLICLCLQPAFGTKKDAARHDDHDDMHTRIGNRIRNPGDRVAEECEVEFAAGQECVLPVTVGSTGVFDACCSTTVALGCKAQSDGSHVCVEIRAQMSKSASVRSEVKMLQRKLKKAKEAAKLRRKALNKMLKLTGGNNKRDKDRRAPHNA